MRKDLARETTGNVFTTLGQEKPLRTQKAPTAKEAWNSELLFLKRYLKESEAASHRPGEGTPHPCIPRYRELRQLSRGTRTIPGFNGQKKILRWPQVPMVIVHHG